MDQDLISYQVPAGLSIVESPEGILKRAALVGRAIDNLTKKQPDLVQVIGGRKHPKFELLQIVSQMFHVTARATSTTRIQDGNLDGWECTAEAFHIPTQSVVAIAQSMCTNDEMQWNTRPKYEWKDGKKVKLGDEPVPTFQRRSMAQTRACSKALRLAVGWVLGLAGYAATAAEEMTGNEDGGAEPKATVQQPQRSSQTQGSQPPQQQNGNVISEAQAKRLYAIAKGSGRDDVDIKAVVKSFGFESSRDITKDKYEAVCTAFEQGDAQ